ncbi:uncharacterized protein LOC108915064, partial [Anoplophora glabripennis]|uniref:uncharacterized protein LOC108915064 n=1 Tax=Anoplophora glabripennis TaxID=217634 RepID=UPI0008753AA4
MSLLKIRASPLNMRKIYDEEDEDNFIFSIREEIVGNTLNQVSKIIQENDVMNLVVDCAVDALRKVIGLHFYVHTNVVDIGHPNWSPDEPIPPSPPDCLTTRMVPIRPQPTGVVTDQKDQKPEPCQCELGVDCLCLKSPGERIEQALMELSKEKPKKTKKSVGSTTVSSSKSSMTHSSLCNTEESELEMEELLVKDEPMEAEVITTVIAKKKPELDVQVQADVKLPKIETPSLKEGKEESKGFDIELPPI